MIDLTGKNAVVTGAAHGIGYAIATRFASLGANVAICDIDEGAAQKATRKISEAHGKDVIALVFDIADHNSVQDGIKSAKMALGPINVLVNCAGINVFSDPLEMTPADWKRCMSINLEGATNCCLAVLPDMIEAGDGAIINIISNHAFTVMKDTFPYPVAKHAMLGLTRSLALQYADKGISINAISPGFTDTRLADAYFQEQPDPEAAQRKVEAQQPPGRLCHPDEIAAIAALLASDHARFMVGENIVIDGGVSIRMYE